MTVLSHSQRRRLFRAAIADEYSALWALLLTSALRHGEARALTWGDWDRDRATVLVSKTVCHDRDGRSVLIELTGPRRREIVICDTVHRAIRRHRVRRFRSRKTLPFLTRNDFIFGDRYGEVPNKFELFDRHLLPVIRVARIRPRKGFRLEDLTHTAAAVHLENGTSVDTLRHIMGLVNAQDVFDLYREYVRDPLEVAADEMDSWACAMLDG